MTKKRWYKSQTIVSSLGSMGSALGLFVLPYFEDEAWFQEVQAILQAAIVATGGAAIQGRIKAKSEIGKPNQDDWLDTGQLVFEEPSPDELAYIASLPGPDSAGGTLESAQGLFIPTSVEGDSEEEEPLEIDLDDLVNRKYYIKAVQDTKLKTSIKDSSVLGSDEYLDFKNGDTADITSWKYSKENNHIEVVIGGESYFAFAAHIELYNLNNKKVDILAVATNNTYISNTKKTPFNLPGMSSTFYLEDPIIPKGHFTWAEATKGGTRLPANSTIVNNIVAAARELENIRSQFGNRPMRITSWYRPPAVNSDVGGASRSKHLEGHAVDFQIVGLSLFSVQSQLQSSWKRGGLGLGAKKGFVHIDLGPYRVWPY